MKRQLDIRNVLERPGAIEILAQLTKPMRYIDLKRKTGLSDGTLTSRIKDLLAAGLVEQKPILDKKSGRYYLAYDIKGGEETRRLFKTGDEWASKEIEAGRLLKEACINAIRSLPNLSDKQKEKAEEYFIKNFPKIQKLINIGCTRLYLESVFYARASK